MSDKELDEPVLLALSERYIKGQITLNEFARRLRAEWTAQQEPCAWGVQMADKWWVGLYVWKENAEQVAAKSKGDVVVPLYTAPVAKLVIDGYPDPHVWCDNCKEATAHTFSGMELICEVCASVAVSFYPAPVTSAEQVKDWLKRASDRRLPVAKPAAQDCVNVPREPTDEMLRAGWNAYLGDMKGGLERFAITYRAMLAAVKEPKT